MLATVVYMKNNAFLRKNKMQAICQYAYIHNLSIHRIYSDKRLSRLNRTRLLIHSRTADFEIVLVYKLSELDKNPKKQARIIHILRKNNIIVVSVKDSLVDPKFQAFLEKKFFCLKNS